MGIIRKVVTLFVVAAVALAGGGYLAYASGVVEEPSAGLEDKGDWGEVTDDRTEIVTSLWVDNPNPVGLTLGSGVSASYEISLNGVGVAEGSKDSIAIRPGNNTVEVSTYLDNDKLVPWWVNFVKNDETVHLNVQGRAHVDAPAVGGTYEFPAVERTMLRDSTPVIDSMSAASSEMEGSYTETATVAAGPVEENVTAGVEVRDAWATWGDVSRNRTTVLFHFRVHNPSEVVPVPAAPDGVGMRVDMNDVTLLRAQGDEFSTRSVGEDAVIRPGETREVVVEVDMDNEKIDEWFTSHVRNGERTRIDVQMQFVYEVPETGTTVRVPTDGGLTYSCEMQTAILEDGQRTATNCGDGGSVGA